MLKKVLVIVFLHSSLATVTPFCTLHVMCIAHIYVYDSAFAQSMQFIVC